jgi:hypothetical protein
MARLTEFHRQQPVTNNANYTHDMPPETPFGQNLKFQSLRPNMVTSVGPIHGTYQTGQTMRWRWCSNNLRHFLSCQV